MFKNILKISVLLLICTQASSQTWYLVRHAEKADDGTKDPALTEQGVQRAHNLAAMLAKAEVETIYATDYQRTQLTAQPLADALGLQVSSYDPGQLPAFAERIKQLPGNALIVGHSNTTPMLAYLLSGQPMSALDEANFDRVIQITQINGQYLVNQLRSLPTDATKPLSQLSVQEDRFFQGQLTFNMKLNDEVVGQSVHRFQRNNGQYQLHERTVIEAYNIHADIEVKVDPDGFAPLSMTMQGEMGGPVDIDLTWQDGHVKGHSLMARDPFKAQGKLEINQQMGGPVMERTSAIMLAHMMPVKAQQPLIIQWFNGYDADLRRIEITDLGEETVSVPAGTFQTRKIRFSGGAPSQYFWIDQQQAKVVKIQVIKSPWHYELVAAERE